MMIKNRPESLAAVQWNGISLVGVVEFPKSSDASDPVLA